MKIRQGFVSNSSSSSFVVVGIQKDAEDCTDTERDNGIYVDDDNPYVLLGDILSFDDNDHSFTLKELQDIFADVSKQYKLPIEDIELYCGIAAT